MSQVMLNGGVTSDISLTRSVLQGCPLSPLLFAIVTHPLLMMLSRLATNGDIVGLPLPSGRKLVAQALADDSFMFLQDVGRSEEEGQVGKQNRICRNKVIISRIIIRRGGSGTVVPIRIWTDSDAGCLSAPFCNLARCL